MQNSDLYRRVFRPDKERRCGECCGDDESDCDKAFPHATRSFEGHWPYPGSGFVMIEAGCHFIWSPSRLPGGRSTLLLVARILRFGCALAEGEADAGHAPRQISQFAHDVFLYVQRSQFFGLTGPWRGPDRMLGHDRPLLQCERSRRSGLRLRRRLSLSGPLPYQRRRSNRSPRSMRSKRKWRAEGAS